MAAMKRLILFFVYNMLCAVSLYAQDVKPMVTEGETVAPKDCILTKSRGVVEAVVEELTEDNNVRYKRYDNLDGPMFTIPLSDVVSISYSDGMVLVFDPYWSLSETKLEDLMKMNYEEYRHLYKTKGYKQQIGDKYNPTLSGVCSFLIPGLGQGIDGEWGRFALFFIPDISCAALAFSEVGLKKETKYAFRNGYFYEGETVYHKKPAFYVIAAVSLAISISSAVNAINIARKKNMYYRDIQNHRQYATLSISPSVDYLPLASMDNYSTVTGLRLTLSF